MGVLMYSANWASSVCDSKAAISPEGVIEKNWSCLRLWNLEYSAQTQKTMFPKELHTSFRNPSWTRLVNVSRTFLYSTFFQKYFKMAKCIYNNDSE